MKAPSNTKPQFNKSQHKSKERRVTLLMRYITVGFVKTSTWHGIQSWRLERG